MRKAFAAALTEALRTSTRTATQIAEALEVSPDAVRKWAREGMAPPPLTVFGLEVLLGVPAGELARHLGYRPAGSAPSVLAAIEGDAALGDEARRLLVGAYKAAVGN